MPGLRMCSQRIREPKPPEIMLGFARFQSESCLTRFIFGPFPRARNSRRGLEGIGSCHMKPWESLEVEENQDQLLALLSKYEPMPPSEYQKRFFRVLINYLDSRNAPVSEALTAHFLQMVSAQERSDGRPARSYRLGAHRLSLHSRTEFSSVAERAWEAGIVLGFFVSDNAPLFKGKRLLELGCGVGTSAAFLALTEPASLLMSDLEEVAPLTLVRLQLSFLAQYPAQQNERRILPSRLGPTNPC